MIDLVCGKNRAAARAKNPKNAANLTFRCRFAPPYSILANATKRQGKTPKNSM